MFMLDSPGIMVPRISDSETALKLTLTGAIRDHIVGEETVCDYLLHCLNTRLDESGRRAYVIVASQPAS
jgi:ribosome biogenesis GTPase A